MKKIRKLNKLISMVLALAMVLSLSFSMSFASLADEGTAAESSDSSTATESSDSDEESKEDSGTGSGTSSEGSTDDSGNDETTESGSDVNDNDSESGSNIINAGSGDGSITVNSVIDGYTYTLYKIFDATYSGDAVSYTATSAQKEFYEDLEGNVFDFSGSNGSTYTVSVKEGVTDSEVVEFLKSVIDECADKDGYGDIIEEVASLEYSSKSGDGSITFTGLEYGYYYIKTDTGALVAITSAAPDAEVYDKSNPPSGEKTITALNGDDIDGDVSADYGDTVTYTITINSVNYKDVTDEDTGETTSYKILSYTIHDTMGSGLKLNSTEETDDEGNTVTVYDVTVKVGNETLTLVDSIPDNYTYESYGYGIYTLTVKTDEDTGKTSITIYIPWVDQDEDADHIYDSPNTITVTYSATLTEDASTGYDLEEDGSTTNRAYFNISTEPDKEWGDFPLTDEDGVTVYTYALAIYKMDSDTMEPLEGAVFEIYDSDGKQIYVVPTDEDGVYNYCCTEGDDCCTYDEDGSFISCENSVEHTGEVTTPSSGIITIKGLSEGTYTLKEVSAPDGYNLLAEDQKIEASLAGSTSSKTVITVYGSTSNNDDDGTDDAAVSYSYDKYEDTYYNSNGETVDSADNEDYSYTVRTYYTVTETKDEDGSTTETKTEVYHVNYNLVEVSESEDDGSATTVTSYYMVTYDEDGEEVKTLVSQVVDTTYDYSAATITISNSSGSQLPSTGGMGTTMLYVIGAVLVLGAGVLLIAKKRMGDKAE